jgi:hypothetical protein
MGFLGGQRIDPLGSISPDILRCQEIAIEQAGQSQACKTATGLPEKLSSRASAKILVHGSSN